MYTKLLQKYLVTVIGLFLIFLICYYKDSKTESDYFSPEVLATHFNGEQFVGSTTCKECHADIYASHIKTAHYNTSALATEKNIKGNFQKNFNTLELQDANITLLHRGDSFFEQVNSKYGSKNKYVSRIDITIGSGVKGQSYFNWKEDKLYQIQTSFYTPTKSWINSPNFSNQITERPISDTCLKCHITFAKNQNESGIGNQYNKDKIIYGIDCERCHRPASKHVRYHRKNQKATLPKFIMRYDTLKRAQRLDACAQCHSGLRSQQRKGSPFSFLVGENLEEYSKNYYSKKTNVELDVHGNQYGLLTSSKCFKESPKMDCTSCHSPHKTQRDNTLYFNQKCISCHNSTTKLCKAPQINLNAKNNNCIGCHMPLSPSKAMKIKLTNKKPEIPVYIRTHLIGIYPEVKNKSK